MQPLMNRTNNDVTAGLSRKFRSVRSRVKASLLVVFVGGQGDADLDASGDVVDDADGLGVQIAGQAVGDEVVLHLPWGLGSSLLPVDGLTSGALETAVLGTGR